MVQKRFQLTRHREVGASPYHRGRFTPAARPDIKHIYIRDGVTEVACTVRSVDGATDDVELVVKQRDSMVMSVVW